MMAPKECPSCAAENDEGAYVCRECGASFRTQEVFVPTPHRVGALIQNAIWDYFAIKCRRFYLAGLFIGLFGGAIGAFHDANNGLKLWSIPVGGSFGIAAAGLLSFIEMLQRRLQRDRSEGRSTGFQRALFLLLGFIALLVAALFVGAACLLFV